MNKSKTTRVLDHYIDSGAPSVSLSACLPAVDGVALAEFKVSTSSSGLSPEGVARAIGNMFGNKLRVLPGTMTSKSSTRLGHTVTARLQAIRPSKVVEPDANGSIKGFTCLSKNLYMEPADRSSWELRKSGSTAMLVRQGDVESDEVLNSILSSMTSISSSAITGRDRLVDQVHSLAASVELGTLVSYLQQGTREHKLGFSLSGVLDSDSGDFIQVVPVVGPVEKVSISSITHAYAQDEYVENIFVPEYTSTSSPNGATSINQMVDYYRKVYGRNDDFFSQFEAQIRQHKL